MSYSSVSGFDSESFSCSRLDTSFELGLTWRDKGRLEIQWGRRGESGNGNLAMFPLIPLPLRSNSLPGPSEWRKESGLYYSLTPALGCAPPAGAGGRCPPGRCARALRIGCRGRGVAKGLPPFLGLSRAAPVSVLETASRPRPGSLEPLGPEAEGREDVGDRERLRIGPGASGPGQCP